MGIFGEVASIIPERLENLLYKYGEVANVYVAACNRKGETLAKFSCNGEECEKIEKIFTPFMRRELISRVVSDGLEDQVIEDTPQENVKVAASAVKQNGRAELVWLFLAQIKDMEPDDTQGEVFVFERQTTMPLFFWAIDVLRDIGTECMHAQYSAAEWKAENRKSLTSSSEMTDNKKRIEVIMELLQQLNSDKAGEYIMQEFLRMTGQYLEIETAHVIKVQADGNRILTQWGEENQLLTQMLEHDNSLFPEGRKPLIISGDTSLKQKIGRQEQDLPYSAMAILPLELDGKQDIFISYFANVPERVWKLEEIQFMKDTIRILQNILERRIHKNSLAYSQASLEDVLENIGCAILVFDIETHELQFMNQKTRLMFPKETLDMGKLEEVRQVLLKEKVYEFCDPIRKTWYEAHRNEIRWRDGRLKAMYSVFDITDKKQYQKRIEQQAYTDFLTGLFNRLCCERDLARTVDEAKKFEEVGALLYLDLDDFKNINDGLGHQYGDILLKRISEEFLNVRGIEETTYRMGGDEFVIIIPPAWYAEHERIIEEIKDIFAKPWALKDGNYYCTMSMGVVSFPDEGDSVAELIKKADLAMYEAKRTGKNRVTRYDSALLSDSNKRLDMEKNMRDATTNGYHEFQIYYQPVIDIQKEGTPCVGAEALIRWNSASMGFVSPADFIPLAEYLGLINPIGNYVLRQACFACKGWNDNGNPEYKVNVNLSVIQLLQNNIVEIVEDTLKETGINPRNLTLEVTESLAINDMERMKGIMRRIRQLGVRIALDDFGTGYSSLNHIREIPLDVIKVDQSFVRDLVEDDYSQSFVKMVAELASTLGVSICVEGIEKYEQYKVLENMKVRLVQGFYFDRPMPKEDFEQKYVFGKSEENRKELREIRGKKQ